MAHIVWVVGTADIMAAVVTDVDGSLLQSSEELSGTKLPIDLLLLNNLL
jgi:hypothetical protein